MAQLTLTKHHGLGNDFLVLVDPGGVHPVGAALARRLCDRHRGVGADGLLRAGPGRDGADVSMEIFNADGGTAEMTGNGIRCLAHAVVESGTVAGPDVKVHTAAGLRRVRVERGPSPPVALVSADMGTAKVGPELDSELGWPGRPVNVGNPHVVLLVPDPDEIDVAGVGRAIDREQPGGMNVEFVAAGPGPDELGMRVWERGVGETMACGTGSCAAAAAAHEWGLVGARVVVRQPGGAAEVELGPDTIVLSGPVERIARIEVEL